MVIYFKKTTTRTLTSNNHNANNSNNSTNTSPTTYTNRALTPTPTHSTNCITSTNKYLNAQDELRNEQQLPQHKQQHKHQHQHKATSPHGGQRDDGEVQRVVPLHARF